MISLGWPKRSLPNGRTCRAEDKHLEEEIITGSFFASNDSLWTR